MAITIYRSTDTSAPILSGQAGKLAGVLDACLVDGYPNAVKASLGQTRAYTGTNIRSYRMPAGSSQSYLGLDDTPAQASRIRGFTAMTAAGVAIASGTHPFPTDVQLSGGSYFYKSSAASATAIDWVLISNGIVFYLWANATANDLVTTKVMAFGDMSSYNLTDPNPCFIIGTSATNVCDFVKTTYINAMTPSHYLAVKYDGLTWSVPFGKIFMKGYGGVGNIGALTGGDFQYPDPVLGGVGLTPFYIHETYTTGVIRGYLPGLWDICAQYPIRTGDILTGYAGTALEGRTFEAFTSYDAATNCVYLIETSDTQNTTMQK